MIWNDNERKTTLLQFKILAGHTSTQEIFALQSLIFQNRSKTRLHCCFIDYKKALDTINREELVKM